MKPSSLLATTTSTATVSMSSPRSSMGSFLKSQVLDAWLVRVTVGALLLGFVILLKFLLDSQPGLIPVDLRLGALSSGTTGSSSSCTRCTNPRDANAARFPPGIFPNSFLPCKDYVRPGVSTFELQNVSRYFHTEVEDSELLHAAQNVATRPLPPGKPRVAFLFITRERVAHEALWERFFSGVDPELYSIYTHNSSVLVDGEYNETSVFYKRGIPTKETWRFTITLVDVLRRLMAFALLDVGKANMWFVLLSESCVPVRSFPYVYDYLMNSTTSFVEGFSPQERFLKYEKWEPVVMKKDVRKGELWMSMHRRHAGMVVGDVTLYRKFKLDCRMECVQDEMYVQTLLHVKDPQGVANRSITYVDWNYNHIGSPRLHTAQLINATLFTKIQNRTENLDGQYWDSSDEWDHKLFRDCVYNGRPHSSCFLFARKFSVEKEDVQAVLNIPKTILGY